MYKTDLELVARASQGDQEAFQALYKKANHLVRTQIFKLCPSEVDDLTQATWAKILTKLGSYQGKAAFTTWAVRIGINEALMLLRRKQYRYELSWYKAFSPDVNEEFEAEPGAEDRRFKAIPLRGALKKAIVELPPRQRTVIVLRMVEDRSVPEVSQMLGISCEAVKAAQHRGVLKLRDALA